MFKDLFFYNPLASFVSRTLRRGGSLLTGTINCLFPKKLYPIPSVTVILERKGKLLVVKRQNGLGKSLPGGIIRWGETIKEAAKREVQEETGFEVSLKKLIGIYSNVPRRFGYNVINLVYEGKITGGEAKSSKEGKPLWVWPKELLEERHFGTKKIVQDYLEGNFPFS